MATAVTALLAFSVYALTLPPDLTWANFGGDGGELITAAVTLGIPHPPGYPTYVLLGKVVSLLPMGTVAYRFHLFSAVCMATAAGIVTATITHVPYPVVRSPIIDYLSPIPAIAAGLTFAFAALVWGQAIIAEVYGLQMLFLALFLWALLTKRPFWLAGTALGLAVTAHLTSLLLLPLGLLLTPVAKWPRLLAGGLLGVAPLLAIPLLALGNSPVIWGSPTTFGGWWWLISGQLYRPNLFNLTTAAAIERARTWAPLLAGQYTLLGVPLLLWGALQWWREPTVRRFATTIGATAVLILLFAFGYGTEDAIVLTLPALLLLSILLGLALARLGPPALLLPLVLLLLNFSVKNLSKIDPINDQARSLLQSIPTNAIVLTPGDPTIFTFWYYQHVVGYRPDLILVDGNLFAFDWYRQRLHQQHPALRAVAEDDLDRFRLENGAVRPFCTAAIRPAFSEARAQCERIP